MLEHPAELLNGFDQVVCYPTSTVITPEVISRLREQFTENTPEEMIELECEA